MTVLRAMKLGLSVTDLASSKAACRATTSSVYPVPLFVQSTVCTCHPRASYRPATSSVKAMSTSSSIEIAFWS